MFQTPLTTPVEVSYSPIQHESSSAQLKLEDQFADEPVKSPEARVPEASETITASPWLIPKKIVFEQIEHEDIPEHQLAISEPSPPQLPPQETNFQFGKDQQPVMSSLQQTVLHIQDSINSL